MHEQYLPTTKPAKLARVIEEIGESLQCYGKLQRFGWSSYDPTVPVEERETNLDALERELDDLLDALLRYKGLK
jgi:hypothetical protein